MLFTWEVCPTQTAFFFPKVHFAWYEFSLILVWTLFTQMSALQFMSVAIMYLLRFTVFNPRLFYNRVSTAIILKIIFYIERKLILDIAIAFKIICCVYTRES